MSKKQLIELYDNYLKLYNSSLDDNVKSMELEYNKSLANIVENYYEYSIIPTVDLPPKIAFDLLDRRMIAKPCIEKEFKKLSTEKRSILGYKFLDLRCLMSSKELRTFKIIGRCAVCYDITHLFLMKLCVHGICKQCYKNITELNTIKCPLCRTISPNYLRRRKSVG